ncbi:MAG: hypothetical protein KL785_04760 [Brevundimonas sp.]|nr:hypothetical protein [Brevundimonas sp.]
MIEALEDDLNTPEAISRLFGTRKRTSRRSPGFHRGDQARRESGLANPR